MAESNFAKSNTESGISLFTRLTSKKRPSIVNLSLEILPDDGPKPGEMIEISGESGTGKTMHTMELIAQTIIPTEYGGKGATAIVIDTNSNFHVPDLMPKIIEKHIFYHRSQDCPSTDTEVLQQVAMHDMETIVDETMKKLQLFKCYSGKEYELALLYCKNFLTTNTNVSLIVIDSISTFYWSDLNDHDPHIRMETYLRRKVQELRHMANEFKLVVIYTRPTEFGNFTPSAKDGLIDYKIHLKYSNAIMHSEIREAHNFYSNKKQSPRKFIINTEHRGIQWLTPHEHTAMEQT